MEYLDWMTSDKPWEMLDFLGKQFPYTLPQNRFQMRRRLRLLAVALCRLRFSLSPAEKLILSQAEFLADNGIPEDDQYFGPVRWIVGATVNFDVHSAVREHWASGTDYGPPLIREIWGNPWNRYVLLSHLRDAYREKDSRLVPREKWLNANGGIARNVLTSIDRDRLYDETPVLADALEDGGCLDPILLNHLRSEFHMKGCWVLDFLLGM